MARLKASKRDDTPAEFSFIWRRSVFIAWSVVNAFFIGWIIWTIGHLSEAQLARSLMWLGIGCIASNVVMALLYYAGASAVDIGVIAQGLAKIRSDRDEYSGYYEGGDNPSEPVPSEPDGEEKVNE